tara:strand:- start:122 stop:235 length:114 start_codon:yes stop_codon:yes gene_type:complete
MLRGPKFLYSKTKITYSRYASAGLVSISKNERAGNGE